MKNNLTIKRFNNIKKVFYSLPKLIGVEAGIWIGALIFLAFLNNPNEVQITICPLKNLGFDFCPGCGLGNSISLMFQGEFYESFISHPLGIFTFVVLCIRIIKITTHNWSNYGKHITTNALS